ncbi:MAG: glycosyltransferase 87 family protein [Candidatus Eremiobacteraeota bacterium]|nr:glycosyltransferase 87 family protein [Candidatus Eremiobacteraeota bacterium]
MTRRVLAITAAACIGVALLAIHSPSERGPAMRDFEAYYAAGSATNAHSDPYAASLFHYEQRIPGVEVSRPELLPFVGAPPALLLWSALARIDYARAAKLWLVVLCAALAATIAVAVARCGKAGVGDACVASLCALSFVPITSGISLGQPALLAYAAAAIALFAATRSTGVTALGVIGCAVQPNVGLASLPIIGKKRGAVAFAISLPVLYLAGAAYLGFDWPIGYGRILTAHAIAERFIAIQYTPAAVLFGFGCLRALSVQFGIAIAIAALVLAVFGIARTQSLERRFGIACCALPLLSGFVHEHNFVLLFIPALWAARRFPARTQAIVVLAFGLTAVNWLDFAQQPRAVAQDAVLAFAALAAIVAWQSERTVFSYGAAVATCGIVAIGAYAGLHHPAPIWPNDMRPFALPPGASAAYIWHAEQVGTGLERQEPAWALLRSLSLAGSSLLLCVLCLAKPLNIDVHEVVERRDRIGVEVF